MDSWRPHTDGAEQIPMVRAIHRISVISVDIVIITPWSKYLSHFTNAHGFKLFSYILINLKKTICPFGQKKSRIGEFISVVIKYLRN
jgi:hypothetical protein